MRTRLSLAELHNITVDTNGTMPQALRLDFELNDPADPEQFYFRSDHYSYAAKGIPILFLTTGAASRLPREHRQRRQDRLPEDGPYQPARLPHRDPRGKPRPPARARQSRPSRRQGIFG